MDRILSKKFMSAILAFVMCFSFLGNNLSVFADTVEAPEAVTEEERDLAEENSTED